MQWIAGGFLSPLVQGEPQRSSATCASDTTNSTSSTIDGSPTPNPSTSTGPASVSTAAAVPKAVLRVDDGTTALPDAVPGEVTHVVVVGAGISGLVAGRALRLAGVDVVVVEARDRIGGRTHTVDVAGTPVDLGAAWVHDGVGTPTLPYINAIGGEVIPARITDMYAGAAVIDRENSSYPDDAAGATLEAALGAFIDNAQALAATDTGASLSLADAIEQILPNERPAVRAQSGGSCRPSTVPTPTTSGSQRSTSSSSESPSRIKTSSPAAAIAVWWMHWQQTSTYDCPAWRKPCDPTMTASRSSSNTMAPPKSSKRHMPS